MRQKGFTLLEVILVLTITALGASLVMMTYGRQNDTAKAITAAEQLAALTEYAADWSTMEDRSTGIEIREQGWRIVTPIGNRWQTPTQFYRLATEGKWESDWQVALFPASLARQSVGTPQILIHPDGEITPFTLHIRSRKNNTLLFTLASTGGLPLVLTRGESR
ncbi:MAG: type II secretion system minor pseudopilin GspH [Citrobacter sp.]